MEKSLTTGEILSVLKQQRMYLHEKFHIKQIGLFGSFARGEATDSSDIDFLVEFDDGVKNLFDLKYELREYLKQQFTRDVDLVRAQALKPYFKERILKQAIYA